MTTGRFRCCGADSEIDAVVEEAKAVVASGALETL
jgi:hypothetical protein